MSQNHATKQIAVGMSGGTDSSAATALLKDQGHNIIGLTAHMWKEGSRCCSLEDVERARKVAWFLDIKHFVLNAQETFTNQVVNPFIAEYMRGRTPSPCVICNKIVKFGFLLTRAVEFNCDAIATGHYARTAEHNGIYHLLKAKDLSKDQSYFLHRLSQRQLAHTIFPLGDMIKTQDVIPYIKNRNLPIQSRGESQDLCFVLDGDHGAFIEQHCTERMKTGNIVDTSGKTLGTHSGIHKFTVGQRKGLKIAAGEPLYVVRIDPYTNDVILGKREEAMNKSCRLENVHWIAGHPPPHEKPYKIRIRYQHNEVPADLTFENNETVIVEFHEPQFAVTPGQAGVIYDDDEVLGGGWIADIIPQ